MFSSIFCVVQDLASVFETFFSVYNLQKEKIEVNQSRSVSFFMLSCFFCESVGVAGSDLGSGWIGWLATLLYFSWRIKQNIIENGCECYSRNIAVLHWCNRFQFNSAAAKYQTPLPP